MKTKLFTLFAATFALSSCNGDAQFIQENFDIAQAHTLSMVETMGDQTIYPRTTRDDGSIRYTAANDWTDGFFPGLLWYLYEANGDPQIKDAADRWTAGLEKMQYMTSNHDIGFLIYCSYGNAYRLTGDESLVPIIVQAAESLLTRFDPSVKAIKSWNGCRSRDGEIICRYPVIIDNMMNLELLYFASRATGNPKYAQVATTHAETTLNNHFRDDFSTYHVVNYDSLGMTTAHLTNQGYANNSTWSRGQAWAIYGYTMVYRETRDPKFLDIAEKAANYFINNPSMPEDGVPLWDFNINQEGFDPQFAWDKERYSDTRDASAAAITTSALLELCGYSESYGEQYKEYAISTLKSLGSDAYRAPLGENNNFILMHCTGSLPHKAEIDKPLTYADYYFLEALIRYRAML